MTWKERLLKEAEIAFERGERVTLTVAKQVNKRIIKIYRERLVFNDQEEYAEED